MQIPINLSVAKFRHLHAILITAATLWGLSLQSDVSGYICGDLVIEHERALKVAHIASNHLTPMNPRFMYPSLLEDTQIFGVEDKNLFLVPFRNFKHIRIGAKFGPDRVVIDELGKLMGVVVDVNNGASVVPAYKKCTEFLTYQDIHSDFNVDNKYKITGFACGSNFLGVEIEEEMKRLCSGLENLSQDSVEFFQLLDQRGINWSDKKLWYKRTYMRDYDSKSKIRPAVYYVEFTSKCRLIQIKQVVRHAFSKPACIETWTLKPSADTNTVNPPLNHQNKNKESSETYLCNDIEFRIVALRNYLNQFISLPSTTLQLNTEDPLIHQNEDLMLWPILSPERFMRRNYVRSIYAMGFNRNKMFTGIYYASSRGREGQSFKQCIGSQNLIGKLCAIQRTAQTQLRPQDIQRRQLSIDGVMENSVIKSN